MTKEITVSQFLVMEKARLESFFDWILAQSRRGEKAYPPKHLMADWIVIFSKYRNKEDPFSFSDNGEVENEIHR